MSCFSSSNFKYVLSCCSPVQQAAAQTAAAAAKVAVVEIFPAAAPLEAVFVAAKSSSPPPPPSFHPPPLCCPLFDWSTWKRALSLIFLFYFELFRKLGDPTLNAFRQWVLEFFFGKHRDP